MKKILYNRGQALLISVVMFLFISTAIGLGILGPAIRDLGALRAREASLQAVIVAESAFDDMYYRLREGILVDQTETLSLGGAIATSTWTDTGSNERDIVVLGNFLDHVRTLAGHLSISSGASFNYGVQSGNGGFIIENSASVSGNVYSNGTVVGSNNNTIGGEVVSSGPFGLIDGVHATSSAYAKTIQNSIIDGNAYYQTITGSTVGGTSFPGSTPQATTTLPITDDLVETWKADALAGGTISSPCPYTISTTRTLGPVKINCDLKITGGRTTLLGPVWVSGNIEISNTADIAVDPTLGNKSVSVIADNPTNRTTGSKIQIQNTTEFFGSGGTGSYVLMLSQNNSSETGGSEKAITVENSASGDLLLYAGHGEVHLKNNINLREVTAYKIRLSNSAQVIYKTGLASLLFTSGPGGSWERSLWEETE